jgi:phenylalanine ammonia-lyase
LALISARQTITSLEVLSILISSYLYVICQGLSCYSFPATSLSEFNCTALDLRALQHEFYEGLITIVSAEFSSAFGFVLSEDASKGISAQVASIMHETFNATSTMDAKERMQKVAASSTTTLLDFFTGPSFSDASLVGSALSSIPTFRSRVAERLTLLLDELRRDYLSGSRGKAPASKYLNKTRPVYEFVRVTLGIRMHGSENYHRFSDGLGVEDVTVGQNVSLIHEVCCSLFLA